MIDQEEFRHTLVVMAACGLTSALVYLFQGLTACYFSTPLKSAALRYATSLAVIRNGCRSGSVSAGCTVTHSAATSRLYVSRKDRKEVLSPKSRPRNVCDWVAGRLISRVVRGAHFGREGEAPLAYVCTYGVPAVFAEVSSRSGSTSRVLRLSAPPGKPKHPPKRVTSQSK